MYLGERGTRRARTEKARTPLVGDAMLGVLRNRRGHVGGAHRLSSGRFGARSRAPPIIAGVAVV